MEDSFRKSAEFTQHRARMSPSSNNGEPACRFEAKGGASSSTSWATQHLLSQHLVIPIRTTPSSCSSITLQSHPIIINHHFHHEELSYPTCRLGFRLCSRGLHSAIARRSFPFCAQCQVIQGQVIQDVSFIA